MGQFTELQEVDMVRSADVLIDAWESTMELTENEMCDQLDNLLSVMKGDYTFEDFKFATDLEPSRTRQH